MTYKYRMNTFILLNAIKLVQGKFERLGVFIGTDEKMLG